MGSAGAYGDVAQCITAAKAAMRHANRLLAHSSAESADQTSAILREVEVQLGCAAAILKTGGARPNAELRREIENLQDEVAVLARFLSEADKLLSGWLHAVRTKSVGYNKQGHAAPLFLVRKVTAEG